MNLAVNARDAMPDGGKLMIEICNVSVDDAYVGKPAEVPPGHFVMLAVTDSGVGMTEATRARIFEPFFTTKEPGRGTGLGLATVYGIVKQLGGAVTVASTEGSGSRFTIHLPRLDARSVAPPAYRAEGTQSAQGETVLVVEDQAALRRVVREVLEEFGYFVLEAGDAPSALRAVTTHEGPIHLLLTDVLLQNASGPDLAERVATLRTETRVLFMSGYADDALLAGVRGSSAAFLAKPFTPDALARKVREVLDAR
jgi:CheY-like chemotaxis protein